jgi:RNA polymerase sigma-70 factor (ECF subfamily)
MADRGQTPEKAQRGVFTTTHWSVVLAAGEGDSETAKSALENLCLAYWYPIYVYVRRRGYGAEDAQDLTQEFFAQLIAKNQFRLADREKGKFRTFLLAVLDYFIAREWSRAHRQKRGGQFSFVSLDQLTPEERYALEPADNDTPEKKFVRQWALTVLRQTMNGLEKECEADGKGALFRGAKHLLSGERDGSYAAISGRLGIGEGAARVAVHRLRHRYGELLREEIGKTVNEKKEVDEELTYLMGVLSQ